MPQFRVEVLRQPETRQRGFLLIDASDHKQATFAVDTLLQRQHGADVVWWDKPDS